MPDMKASTARPLLIALALLLLPALAQTVHADPVKITPLGARTGEFCSQDRAMIFEDPTGVRILYDPGSTVAGSADPRLGTIDVVLLSHAHSDHLGSARLNQNPDDSGASCSQAATSAVPATNTAEIIASKNSVFIGTGEIGTFLSAKSQANLGISFAGCPSSGPGNETTVPRSQPCMASLGYGAKRTIRKTSASDGVRIAIVPANHGNALGNNLLNDPLATQLNANGLSIAPGTASGYIIQFTNGLVAYLSGDAGLSSDMLTVVQQYYHANLAVFNIGDIFTTGPEEAAYAMNSLINPVTVIPSHANEVATSGGMLLPGTKTARFRDLVGAAVVLPPLSGREMQFDGAGHCIDGCTASVHRTR